MVAVLGLFFRRTDRCGTDATFSDAKLTGCDLDLGSVNLFHLFDRIDSPIYELVGLELDPIGSFWLYTIPQGYELGAKCYLLLEPVWFVIALPANVPLDLVCGQQVDHGRRQFSQCLW